MIAIPRHPRARSADGLEVALDRRLPASIPVGSSTAILCAGTCFHPRLPVVDLEIAAGGFSHRPIAQRMPRPDLLAALHPSLSLEQLRSVDHDARSPRDPGLMSYRSGFWATVPIEAPRQPGVLEIGVVARLGDGRQVACEFGRMAVVEPPAPHPLRALPAAAAPLIAICMATFNPDVELFRAQIDSIRAQTDSAWICLISDDRSREESFESIRGVLGDDPRFFLSRAPEHLGFYRNFERALSLVPSDAELVALSDHDDRWHPDKLASLRAAIGSSELVYSDLRLIEPSGAVRAGSLWGQRHNNRTNLASLLISNTIPGAAVMFRRRVMERALPFPDGPGWNFHDHWLALVALTLGELSYVDRPLYDYVQHPGAVLGRVASGSVSSPERPGLRARIDAWRGFVDRWRSTYFGAYLHRVLLATVLLARCDEGMAAPKRRALRRFVDAERSLWGFGWLAVRPARRLIRRNETLGLEGFLARGIAWRHLIGFRSRMQTRAGPRWADASFRTFDPKSAGSRRRRWLAGD